MAAETHFRAMGTGVHVFVHGDPALLTFARERIEHLEHRWSRFLPSSEVSALNALAGRPVVVSRGHRAARRRGHRRLARHRRTIRPDRARRRGARGLRHDVRRRRRARRTRRELAAARLRRHPFDRVTSIVELPAGVGFDPGGIGKGLAADLVVDELLAAGAHGACVNIGGDVRVEGDAPDGGDVARCDRGPGRRRTRSPSVSLGAGGVATSTTARRTWTAGRIDDAPHHRSRHRRSGVDGHRERDGDRPARDRRRGDRQGRGPGRPGRCAGHDRPPRW